MSIKKQIIECAQSVGISLNEDEWICIDEITSFEFIAFLIEIETQFGIVIPETHISLSILKSLDEFQNLITHLVNQKKHDEI